MKIEQYLISKDIIINKVQNILKGGWDKKIARWTTLTPISAFIFNKIRFNFAKH